MKAISIFLSLAGALVTSASAQASGDTIPVDTIIPLEGVVVSTVRPTATTGGSSALVVSPDSLHVVPAPTLEEVLRELPFVAVRENSRGQAEITIRGSESRQTAVLIDGIPLTLGWDHRTDPSVVPVTGARTITLIRGLHSVLYGPNVLGGVVEVGIAQGPRPGREEVPERSATLSAGLAEHGSAALAGSVRRSFRTDAGEWRLAAGGGFRERSAVAVPGAAGDTLSPRAGLRTNSDLRHLDSFASVRYDAEEGQWAGLTAAGYTAERGVPPELHVADPRLWRYPQESRALAIVSAGSGHRRTPWGTGDVEASVGFDAGRSEIQKYETPRYERVIGGETGSGSTLTVRLLGDHTVGGGTLTGAATFADVRHREGVPGVAPTVYRQRLWSLASEIALPIAPGRVSAGIALDGADTPESGGRPPLGRLNAWGARLGASTLVAPNARAHAAVSRRARFPSLRELYSGALGRFDPNPGLRPETLLGGEVGVTLSSRVAELQLVGFNHRLEDAVVRTVTAEGLFRRENRHAIHSTGLELLGDAQLGPVRARGDLVVQSVRMHDRNGDAGLEEPEHQPRVRLGAAAEVSLSAQIRALASAKYTGAQFCLHPDTGSETRLAPGARVDVGLQRSWDNAPVPIRASAFLDNATDAAVFDQCGLPQPGRTFRVAVQLG